MSTARHSEPSPAQRTALQSSSDDAPVVALNLNRYRERAAYPPGTPDADVSGRVAYMRYGVVAFRAIAAVGGRILWATEGRECLIGCEHDAYHEVVAVWYPSRKAFASIEEVPGYRDAFEFHRRAAVEHATLLVCDAAATPVLTSPFGGG
jgi:uncharacterized protein (DUF1330 family)